MFIYRVEGSNGDKFFTDSLNDVREYFELPKTDVTIAQMNKTLYWRHVQSNEPKYEIAILKCGVVCENEV